MIITLTTPNAVFTAPSFAILEDQLMGAQAHGSYPAYWRDDDAQDWESFDGRYYAGDGDPHLTADDAIDYAAWSLDIDANQITLTTTPPRLTGIELTATRERLGLTCVALGTLLSVSERTIRNWEQEKYPIPDGIRDELTHLEDVTADTVRRLVDAIDATADDEEPAEIVAWRTDPDFSSANRGSRFTSAWWRTVAYEAMTSRPGTRILTPTAQATNPVPTIGLDE